MTLVVSLDVKQQARVAAYVGLHSIACFSRQGICEGRLRKTGANTAD